jgi:hypothetical protein
MTHEQAGLPFLPAPFAIAAVPEGTRYKRVHALKVL